MFHLRHVDYLISENYPMKMRRHQGLYEFYMFLYCHSPLIVYTPDGEELYAKPGSFIIYSPNKPQYWDAAPPRFLHSYVTFTVDEEDYFKELGLDCDVPISPNMNKEISETIKEIIKEAKTVNDIGKRFKIDALINNMFVDISRKLHEASSKKNVYEESILERFEQARFSIFEDPSSKISEYAAAVGFSTRRFQQYYKKFFNVVPSEDLQKAKLMLAKELLKRGEQISSVAEKAGFESVEYFSKWFHKLTGVSVSAYRAENEK